ncbi:ubx domain-containing protein 4 [Lynx pardinus]|uniref:UBX domain-containing protein 4 n=1 Tax=Lynx pardinus TaxID=191816 RepID=A0A485NT85_LYNPA|nr:ubx domain-containing protein 4 [Lynx pardinus]
MAASWEDEKVTEASSDSFVAIKIDTKSEACLQFSQIYPVVCVPSSFFIGDSGIPLEVIAGSVSADELVTRIHKVRQMHSLKGETSVANGSPSESSVSTPSTSLEPNNTSENSQSRNVEPCEIPPTSDTKSDSATGESSGHASPSQEPGGCSNQRPPEDLTVRVERLTKKLEERREEKRKEEEQREIKKEIERRKTGKEMLDYKRKQEEELTKRMLEERNREKAEDRAARERIKQQIALDRAERAARFAKTKEEVEAAKAAALLAKQAEMEVKRDSSARERSTIARIQFRLPDGSSFTNQFPSDAPLEEARQFAAQTVGNTYGNFSLATMFPRREFTKEDYKKKLLDLELAPSASVVLLPAGRPTTSMVHSSSGDFWTLLGTVLYPFLAIWRLISNFLFSNPPAQTSVRAAASEPSNLASSSNSEKREPVRKRVLEKRGEDFKKEGKIYRLRTQDDGEDENNTWNGNSTQQM